MLFRCTDLHCLPMLPFSMGLPGGHSGIRHWKQESPLTWHPHVLGRTNGMPRSKWYMWGEKRYFLILGSCKRKLAARKVGQDWLLRLWWSMHGQRRQGDPTSEHRLLLPSVVWREPYAKGNWARGREAIGVMVLTAFGKEWCWLWVCLQASRYPRTLKKHWCVIWREETY